MALNNQNQTPIDIKTYVFKVLAYWKLFLVAICIAFITAKVKNDYAQERYSINTTISVKEENNPLFSTGTNIAFNWGGSSDQMETIRVILISRSHNEKVVDFLDFYVDYLVDDSYNRKKDVYGYAPFKVVLDKEKPQLYNRLITVETLSKDKFRISGDFNLEGNTNLITYKSNVVSAYQPNDTSFSYEFTTNKKIELPFLNFTLKQLSTLPIGKKYYIRFNSFDGTVAAHRNVRVTQLTKAASLIRLQKEGTNKKRVRDYLNATVKVLEADKKNQKIEYAVKTKEYIESLFLIEKDSLNKIEKGLGDFKKNNDIYNLSAEGSQIFNETLTIESQQRSLKENIDYLDRLKSYILSHQDIDINIPAPAVISIQDNKIPTQIGVLIEKSILKKVLSKAVNDTHPDIIALNNEIEIAKNILLENIRTLKATFKVQLTKIDRRLASYKTKLKRLPKKEQGLLKFQRNFEISEGNYNYLKQKSYEAGTAIAANVSDVKIIDTAKLSESILIYPKPGFNYLIALMLGVVFPLFYIIIREVLDNKVYTVEEIEKNYKIPVLGVVGRNEGKGSLAVYNQPKSSLAESFRALRSNIQFLFKDPAAAVKAKTLLVTSSISGEGKTMISINMATAFALSGKKTLLLGLDLRKPKIFQNFDIKNDVGVVNYLINQKTLDEIIIQTEVPNLDLLLAGPIPPNPSELLLNDKVDDMFRQFKQDYDYIVVDTPPVGLVSDALELFKYSDAIIYVIRQNYSQKGMMKMIDDKYINKEVSNISYVLNDFSIRSKYGYGYGNGYDYSYGYGYGGYSYGYHENNKKSSLKNKILKVFRKNS